MYYFFVLVFINITIFYCFCFVCLLRFYLGIIILFTIVVCFVLSLSVFAFL